MRRDDGFTLIETLVALAVLATGAVALLGVVEDHTGRIAGLGSSSARMSLCMRAEWGESAGIV